MWQPSKYDSIWGGCASYLSTAFPADYSIAVKTNSVSFAAPCKFVGDILAGSKTTSGGSGALKTSGPATVTQTVTAGSGAERIAVVVRADIQIIHEISANHRQGIFGSDGDMYLYYICSIILDDLGLWCASGYKRLFITIH